MIAERALDVREMRQRSCGCSNAVGCGFVNCLNRGLALRVDQSLDKSVAMAVLKS